MAYYITQRERTVLTNMYNQPANFICQPVRTYACATLSFPELSKLSIISLIYLGCEDRKSYRG